MSKICCLLLGGCLLGVFACSNEIEMPVPYHRDYLAQPTDVEAALDEDRRVHVSWRVASADHIEHFVVGFTDSTGAEQTRPVLDPQATDYTDQTLVLPSPSIYLVRVWAVDDRNFFGPPSMPDSLIVP